MGAADVRFCHLAVGQSAVNVKGKIGMMETAVIMFPGCETLTGVDMSATQFELVNAADDTTIATANLMMPSAAGRDASYVLVVPDATNNATFLQPRATADIGAGNVQALALHAGYGVPAVNVTIGGAQVLSNVPFGATAYLDVGDTVLAAAIGDVSVTTGNDRARWFLDVVST